MCNVSEREGDRETGQETGREREREREGVIERERASGRERGSEQARSRLRQHESDRERPSVASSAHSRHGRAPLSRASIRAGVGCSAVVAHACFLMCVLVSAMLSSHTCSVAPVHSPTVFACSAGQQTKTVARPSTALSLPRVAGRTQPSVHFGGEKSLQDMVYQVSPVGTSSAWTRTHIHF